MSNGHTLTVYVKTNAPGFRDFAVTACGKLSVSNRGGFQIFVGSNSELGVS